MSKKKLTTHIVFVQDETGSMHRIKDDTVGGFNTYFETLKKEHGTGVSVEVWQFSKSVDEDNVRSLYKGTLRSVPKLTDDNYKPRGNTPLYDAVGTAIQNAEKIEADRYIFIVQTDGEENSSTDFDQESVKSLVQEKEKAENWSIVFLGVDFDTWGKTFQMMGASRSSGIGSRAEDSSLVYSSLARATGQTLSSPDLSSQTMASDVNKKLSEV